MTAGDALLDFFAWCFNNIFVILIILFLVWEGRMLYKTLFLQPIRGGNGIAQMDEVAKWLMMVYLGYMVWKEGEEIGQAYPEGVFWAMVIGAFLIAGVKEFAVVLGKANPFQRGSAPKPPAKKSSEENLG